MHNLWNRSGEIRTRTPVVCSTSQELEQTTLTSQNLVRFQGQFIDSVELFLYCRRGIQCLLSYFTLQNAQTAFITTVGNVNDAFASRITPTDVTPQMGPAFVNLGSSETCVSVTEINTNATQTTVIALWTFIDRKCIDASAIKIVFRIIAQVGFSNS